MSIIRDLVDVQKMRLRVAVANENFKKLENRVSKLQALVKDDIISLQEKETKYKGNSYSSYGSAVAAINDKYSGTADWGVLQTGAIIDLRAAFVINEGIKIVAKNPEIDAKNEIDWVKRFLEYNNLDNEVTQEFAKEAEIEGKIAIKLALESTEARGEGKQKKNVMVSARYISWTDKKYVVKTNPQDYMDYQQLVWNPKGKSKQEVLDKEEFVYKKFGGRISQPNKAAPKIMKCLTQIENLDKALRDWREINNIFSAPILAVLCGSDADVDSAQEALRHKNWKVKKVFVSKAKLYYAQFDIKGIESIEKEIITLAKMISGTTGIPVGALGLPELMSNRATAENLMEFVLMSTSKERQIWKGVYEELISKAMVMYNKEVNSQMSKSKQLNPDLIKVEIPVVTKDQWEHLKDVFLPAVVAGKISDELFLERIPGVDLDKEKSRNDQRQEKELEAVKRENADLLAEKNASGGFGLEENL